MRKTHLSIAAVAVLTLVACGDDDGGASGSQGEVADQLIESAEAEGMELDRDCVNDLAGQLSDADADAIIAAGPDGDPEVSAEGEALADGLFSCVDSGALADMMVSQLEASGMEVDRDCVEDALSGINAESLAGAEDGDLPEGVMTAMFDCIDLSGG